eukprot:gene19816-21755_t
MKRPKTMPDLANITCLSILLLVYLTRPCSALLIQHGKHALEVKNNSKLTLHSGAELFSIQPLYIAELTSDGRQIIDNRGVPRIVHLNRLSFQISNVTLDESEPATFKEFSLSSKFHIDSKDIIGSGSTVSLFVKNFFKNDLISSVPYGTTPTNVGTTELKIHLYNYTMCSEQEGSCFAAGDTAGVVNGTFLDFAVALSDVKGEVGNAKANLFNFDNGNLSYSKYVSNLCLLDFEAFLQIFAHPKTRPFAVSPLKISSVDNDYIVIFMVDVNGVLEDIVSGYPKIIKNNTQHTIILRFKISDDVASLKYSHFIANVVTRAAPSPASSLLSIEPSTSASLYRHKFSSLLGGPVTISPLLGGSVSQSVTRGTALWNRSLVTRYLTVVHHRVESTEARLPATDITRRTDLPKSIKSSDEVKSPSSAGCSKTAKPLSSSGVVPSQVENTAGVFGEYTLTVKTKTVLQTPALSHSSVVPVSSQLVNDFNRRHFSFYSTTVKRTECFVTTVIARCSVGGVHKTATGILTSSSVSGNGQKTTRGQSLVPASTYELSTPVSSYYETASRSRNSRSLSASLSTAVKKLFSSNQSILESASSRSLHSLNSSIVEVASRQTCTYIANKAITCSYSLVLFHLILFTNLVLLLF